MNLLRNNGQLVLDAKERLERCYNSPSMIESKVSVFIDEISKKLINYSTRDLRLAQQELVQRLSSILKENLKNIGINNHEPEKIHEQNIIEYQLKIIEATIHNKQQYQKQFTHPVERNLIDHGLFSTTVPNQKTLKQMRTPEGIIQYEKQGCRKLYYRNDNGNLLTPYDAKVLIGIFKLWMHKGKNRLFSFKFKELLKELHSEPSGGEYELVAKSLENIAQTSIIMEEYFNPKSGKRTKTSIFNLIQNAEIDHINNKATVELNNYLHESLAGGNYIKINMSLFNDLATPTSKNLYLNIINKLPEDIRYVEIDTLIKHLDLHSSTRTKALTLIKQAFEELKIFNVIDSFEIERRGRKAVKIFFTPTEWLDKQEVFGMVGQLS